MTYRYRGSEPLAVDEAWDRALAPRPKEPAKRGNGKTVHGTVGGYGHHRRDGENPCDPCRAANNRRQAERRGGTWTGRTNHPVPVCGTLSGYRRHGRDGVAPCFRCRVAFAAYMRGYNARRRADAD